jgi:hypothetical protein
MSIEVTYNNRKIIVQKVPYYISIRRCIVPVNNYTQRYVFSNSFRKIKSERKIFFEFTPKIVERKIYFEKPFYKVSSSRICFTPKGINPSNERKIYFLVNNQKLTYTFKCYLTFRYSNDKKVFIQTNDKISQRKCCFTTIVSDYRKCLVQRFTHLNVYSLNSVIQITKNSERKIFIETLDKISQRKCILNVLRYDYRYCYIQLNKGKPIYTFKTQLQLSDYTERKIAYSVNVPHSERKCILEQKTKFDERKIIVPFSLYNERKVLVQPINDKDLYEFKTLFAKLKITERKCITKGYLIKDERKCFIPSTEYSKYYRKQKLYSFKYENIGSTNNKISTTHLTIPNHSVIHSEIKDLLNPNVRIDAVKNGFVLKVYKNVKSLSLLNYEIQTEKISDNNGLFDIPGIRLETTIVDVSQNKGYSQQKELVEKRLWKGFFQVQYIERVNSERKCIVYTNNS